MPSTTPSTLKLALVGCGAIARFHLDGINERAFSRRYDRSQPFSRP